MRRVMLGTLALILSITLTPTVAKAQGFIGAGATLPSGDYGDYAKTGWAVNAGFRPWMSADERAALWVEGLFASNKHEGSSGDKTNLFGGFASGTYGLTTGGTATPYIIGSVGYLVHSYKPGTSGAGSESEGGLGFGGGAGVEFSKFYIEGRYLTAKIEGSTTAFLMFTFGRVF